MGDYAGLEVLDVDQDDKTTGVIYTIGSEVSSTFVSFIPKLRNILADHPGRDNICDDCHPLLARCRADISVKLIYITLKVVDSNEEVTLAIREDNLYVSELVNKAGNHPTSELFNGMSYKSLLGAKTRAEVIEKLEAAELGKTFAVKAVRVLSHLVPPKDDDSSLATRKVLAEAKLALAGLSFMVCESAALNDVFKAIKDGWEDGSGFHKELMINYVSKYHDMSWALLQWKARNYSGPRPDSELRAVYLVLNEEYIDKRDYPEMLRLIEMFEAISEATVEVDLQLNDEQHSRVYGKITALIKDESNANFQVWRGVQSFSCLHELKMSVVAVPSGWVLDFIKVELCTENEDSEVKILYDIKVNVIKGFLETVQTYRHPNFSVVLKVTAGATVTLGEDKQHFPRPLSCPVEVKMINGHLTVLYTIGDALSFTEFVMVLRRIVADHPDREDIMDGFGSNTFSNKEHPVLAKQRSEQPARWLHVRLQVANANGDITSSTTLVVRDDSMYILGYVNQEEDVFGLRDTLKGTAGMLPEHVYRPHWLKRTVDYTSILNGNVKVKLSRAGLNWDFAKAGVKALSLYGLASTAGGQEDLAATAAEDLINLALEAGGEDPATIALAVGGEGLEIPVGDDPAMVYLAGLSIMNLESARMNPMQDAFAPKEGSAKGFTEDMMDNYVWRYASRSQSLITWKRNGFKGTFPTEKLDTIHLVLNCPQKKKQVRDHAGGNITSGGGDCDSGGGMDDSSSGGDRGVGGNSIEGGSSNECGGGGGGGRGGADKNRGSGRQLVELLSMRARLGIVGTKIIVFDGRRGQIIYKHKEEKAQGGMIDLELTGPYTGISACGPFAIKIVIPAAAPIKWEWDCYDPERIKEVDEPPKTETIGNGIAEVTYAVMSDALEAYVQKVKLTGLPDGHNQISIHGEVTALIDSFNGRKSFLFKHRQEAPLCLTLSEEKSWFLLPLARNVVAVPCGDFLNIEVNVQIVEIPNKQFKANLTFGTGIQSQVNNDKDVEVNIIWHPEIKVTTSATNQEVQKTSDDIGEQIVFTPEPGHYAETAQPRRQLEQTSEEIGELEFTTTEKSIQEGYINMRDYPEMLRLIEMFEAISEAAVEVNLQLNDEQHSRVYGKITALIKDESNANFQVWRGVQSFSSQHELKSTVAVPSGWVVDVVKVDLCIENDKSEVNNLYVALNVNKGFKETSQTWRNQNCKILVRVKIQGATVVLGEDKQHLRLPLSCPVEVKLINRQLTVVYTIGDALSFTEFVMILRRILADHPDRKDILDDYFGPLTHIFSARDHPMLAKQRFGGPTRCLHIRLQVANDDGEITSWTTLVMRDDNLCVVAFINQAGDVYGLEESMMGCEGMLAEHVHLLKWTVRPRSIRERLLNVDLCDFAKDAVRTLSLYSLPASAEGGEDDHAIWALGDLTCIVGLSVAMNPCHDAFAAAWSSGSGCTAQLNNSLHLRSYGDMSRDLRIWKRRGYPEPYPIEQLQAMHLVVNDPAHWDGRVTATDPAAPGQVATATEFATMADVAGAATSAEVGQIQEGTGAGGDSN